MKPPAARHSRTRHGRFSAALCRGLIEAARCACSAAPGTRCFPRLYAAASLKQVVLRDEVLLPALFSAALCRGLIEAGSCAAPRRGARACFPRLYAAASLKRAAPAPVGVLAPRFPRLYAAASLKLTRELFEGHGVAEFSAALCRGLIEAMDKIHPIAVLHEVFRGFMPRPH